MLSHDKTEVMDFWEEYNRGEMLFSLHLTTEYLVSICLITGDVNLGHLVRGVFARFLHSSYYFSLSVFYSK